MKKDVTSIKFESDNGIIKKVTRLLTRPNGNQVRIVSVLAGGLFCRFHTDTWVLHRDSEQHDWALCNSDRHPNVKAMSRQEYMEKGRPELYRKVGIGELLKNATYIGRHLSEFA